MDRDEVVVSKNAKITWPIFNHLDRTRLVNKGFISYDDNENFFCGTNAGNPILPARVARMFPGFAWSSLLRPSQGCFRNFSKGFILRVSFSFVITYPGNLALTAIYLILNCPMSVPILDLTPLGPSPPQRLPLGVPIKNSKYKRKIECARGGGGGREGGRWEEGKGTVFSLFPSLRAPGASFFFHSSLPTTHRSRSAEGRPSMVHARNTINLQVFPLPIRPVLNWILNADV